jgi:hypothetical protein
MWARRVGAIVKALLVGTRDGGLLSPELGDEDEDQVIELPFLFQDDERLLMVRLGTHYYEDRRRSYTVYGGAAGGWALWSMGGARTRGYGVRQEYQERVPVGTGTLAVTTKRLYFHCETKSLRIPFSKLVMCVPYSDGFEIHQDHASALPQVFVTGVDGTDVCQAIQQRGRLPQLPEGPDEEEGEDGTEPE